MNVKKNYCFSVLLLILMCLPCFARGKERYIAVEEIKSKSSPSVWSRGNDIFFYGDKVVVEEEKGSWIKVSQSGSGKSGWVKESCVTSRKIRAGNRVSVNADEIALAGKGFSNSIEAEYSSSYDIDFSIVDSVESVNFYNTKSLRDFIVDGKLMGAE